jgi:hypothetical protein
MSFKTIVRREAARLYEKVQMNLKSFTTLEVRGLKDENVVGFRTPQYCERVEALALSAGVYP